MAGVSRQVLGLNTLLRKDKDLKLGEFMGRV